MPGAHPYWYAAVLGVFHADVQHFGAGTVNPRPQVMEFLWVRWLGVVEGHKYGRRYGQLPKVGFVPNEDEDAFGFLDPSMVIRGCHLMPAFIDGRTASLLHTNHPSEARPDKSLDDWAYYYVGM